ncbi:MAG: hypothetical protein U0354_00375 [Candidatus Sericytochromatia bacterium]
MNKNSFYKNSLLDFKQKKDVDKFNLEKQIDQLAYKLHDLTDDEIQIMGGKV